MEINLNPGRGAELPVRQAAAARPDSAPAADESGSFQPSQSLENALNQTPVVRADKVARAQQLLADVKYPPDELLNGIAHLLAVKLSEE